MNTLAKQPEIEESIKSSIEKGSDDLLVIDRAEERKAIRKLDFCLIPLVALFYLLAFLVSLPSIALCVEHADRT